MGHHVHAVGRRVISAHFPTIILITSGDLAGGSGDRIGTAAHFTHDSDQALAHVFQCLQQLSGFILPGYHNMRSEVAGRYGLRDSDGEMERMGYASNQPNRDSTSQGDGQKNNNQ